MNEKLYLSVYVFSCKLMEDTMIAAIDHKHSNSCPFLMFSSVAEKTGHFHEVILAVGDMHVERWPFMEVRLYVVMT